MQLVLSNNRVIAHGENFLTMGGTVINTVTGVKYENATVAECEGCPSDIDSVGYEYHAGQFIPCAPYGKGYGNIAVLCDRDCKAIKDSGICIQDLFLMLCPHTLLWENASSSSIFNNQTITLASGDYDILLVEHEGGINAIAKNSKGAIRGIDNISNSSVYENIRKIEDQGGSVIFDTCYRVVHEEDAYISINNNNAYAKPKRIYGIKLGVTI